MSWTRIAEASNSLEIEGHDPAHAQTRHLHIEARVQGVSAHEGPLTKKLLYVWLSRLLRHDGAPSVPLAQLQWLFVALTSDKYQIFLNLVEVGLQESSARTFGFANAGLVPLACDNRLHQSRYVHGFELAVLVEVTVQVDLLLFLFLHALTAHYRRETTLFFALETIDRLEVFLMRQSPDLLYIVSLRVESNQLAAFSNQAHAFVVQHQVVKFVPFVCQFVKEDVPELGHGDPSEGHVFLQDPRNLLEHVPCQRGAAKLRVQHLFYVALRDHAVSVAVEVVECAFHRAKRDQVLVTTQHRHKTQVGDSDATSIFVFVVLRRCLDAQSQQKLGHLA